MRQTALLLCSLLLACSKSQSKDDKRTEAYEKRRTDLTARVDKILDLALKPGPPLTEDKVSGVAELDTDWQLSSDRFGNAVVVTEWTAKGIHDGHFFDKDGEGRVQPSDVTPGGVKVGKFFANKETTDFEHLMWWTVYSPKQNIAVPFTDPERADTAVEKFLGFRYVVLVRVFELQPAKINWAKDSSTQGTFTPGHVVGEVRIFDVDGKDHGGVRFAAEHQSPKVELKRNEIAFAEDEMMGTLTFVALEQITAKLKAQVGKLNLK